MKSTYYINGTQSYFAPLVSHDTVVLNTTFPTPIRLIVYLQGYLRQSKPNKHNILTNFKPMIHFYNARKEQQTRFQNTSAP